MSPLWRDEVTLKLGPGIVSLARRRRGLKPQVVLEKSIAVPEDSAGGWLQALSAVRRELEGDDWRKANVRAVVADHWIRYAVVPWRQELTSDAERLGHGRLILRQIYGDEMTGWTMQLGQTATGSAQLVCAIPTAFLADLNAALQQSGLRLQSLCPHLVVTFNRWRHRIPDGESWFVTVDDGCLTAVRIADANWAEVHRVRAGSDWPADLNRLQTIGRLANAGQTARSPVLVAAPVHLRSTKAAIKYGLAWLDAGEDGRFASRGRREGHN